MPFWFQIVATCFATLFFLGYVSMATYSMRFQVTREGRLEAWGSAVPGFGGVLLACVVWLPAQYHWLSIPLLVLTVLLIVVGRPIYELLVFGKSRHS